MPIERRLSRKTQEVAVLSEIAQLLITLDLDKVLSRTLHLITDTIGAERGSFFLLKEGSRTAEHMITRRDLPPEHSRIVVDQVLAEGLAGWVYHNKQAAVVDDTFTDERWVTFPDDESPVRAVLCVPFLYDEQIYGIVTLEHSTPGHFTEEDLSLTEAVANQATIAIRNAQLFTEVEKHERQLKAMLESTEAPLLTIDPRGTLTVANSAALTMLDRSYDDVIGQRLAEICTKPPFNQVVENLQNENHTFELRDDDHKRDYSVQISPWRDPDSDEVGYVLVFNDITSLKDLGRVKSQMLQMASHDLKNPLGVIQGYVQIMMMDIAKSDPLHEYVENINSVTRRMLSMVEQLLDLERMEAGPQRDHMPFHPGPLLEDIIPLERDKATSKQQLLLTEVASNLPELVGDKAQIREAFTNLIDNAIKYTPEGGTITVRAAVNSSDHRLEFAVEDTGYGIDESLQDKIFERFYRAKQTGTEHISGTGLGLSLVKAVIEQHGGKVWFTSTAGKGSTFGFWLPLPERENNA